MNLNKLIKIINKKTEIETWKIGLFIFVLFVFYLYGAATELKLKNFAEQNLCFKKISDFQYQTCELDCSNKMKFCDMIISNFNKPSNSCFFVSGEIKWSMGKEE